VIELRCAREELAGNLGLLRAQPESCSEAATRPRYGGMVGGVTQLAPRSRITTVPAKDVADPMGFGESMLQITAGMPNKSRSRRTDPQCPKQQPRSASGPPSSDTTRRPITILPTVRTARCVSKTRGYPTEYSR